MPPPEDVPPDGVLKPEVVPPAEEVVPGPEAVVPNPEEVVPGADDDVPGCEELPEPPGEPLPLWLGLELLPGLAP